MKNKKMFLLPVIFVLLLLIFGCRSMNSSECDTPNFYSRPSVAITAQSSINVYVAKIESVDETVKSTKVRITDNKELSIDVITFTAKVEQVFKGEYEVGTTVTDTITCIYKDFLIPDETYALCTGYVKVDAYDQNTYPYWDIYCLRSMAEEYNTSAAVKINSDDTLTYYNKEKVVYPKSCKEELFVELYDTQGFFDEIREMFDQNVTQIKMIYIPQYGDKKESEYIEKRDISVLKTDTDKITRYLDSDGKEEKDYLYDRFYSEEISQARGIVKDGDPFIVYSLSDPEGISVWKSTFLTVMPDLRDDGRYLSYSSLLPLDDDLYICVIYVDNTPMKLLVLASSNLGCGHMLVNLNEHAVVPFLTLDNKEYVFSDNWKLFDTFVISG